MPRFQRVERLDASNLRAYARGCAILGSGGGGDVGTCLLQALQAVQDFGSVPVVGLEDLPDDALVVPCGAIGAPTVSFEKFESGEEGRVLEEVVEELTGARVAALMAGEIGGGNGLVPVMWAARAGLPLVDADGMGRAFPEMDQESFELAGVSPSPAVLTDERGNVVILKPLTGKWLERLARDVTVSFGGTSSGADHLMSAAEARRASVIGSVARALAIGRAVRDTTDPVGALVSAAGAVPLLVGKVVDVERTTAGGFARGHATVDGTGADAGRVLGIDIQNENLVATETARGRVVASVPDLITIVDEQTADAIPTERLRYGQRVRVLALPCDPVWRTPEGLRLAGPGAFGYGHEYVPVEPPHA
ncbi:MAG TPA: DUF917 domain-containing protein [Actinomycetota bacterium]|nr:DUF917 domain-containing protein [Actinomycetota bacterium]